MTTLRVAAAAGSALALALAASAVAGAASEQPGRRPRATLPAAAVEDLMKTVRRTGPEGANDGGGSDGASSSTRPRRRLDEFEVDGSYSLKFSQCVDLKLMDKDLFDDEFVSFTKAGQITSTKSYVLFHVCQDNDCYYESEDDLYLVDLSTYAGNVASAFAASRNAYCDSCDTYYYDTCVAAQGDDGANDDAANDDGGDDAVAYDDAGGYYAANDDDGGGQRRRDRGLATTYIDCDTCQAYGCLDDGDDNNGNNQNQNQNGDDDPVLEFIEGVAECFNTGVKWNDEELYVGFMCSPYSGDGVELAVFLDNECTVYTTLKAFGDMPSWYLYDSDSTFEAAETHIKSAFTETLSCQYETFGDPANQNGDDAYNYNNDDNNGNEATEYCQNIFEDGGAIAFNSCLNNNQNNNNNNNENDDNYKWYDYDLNYDDAQDLDGACYALQLKDGEYDYNYNEGLSGTWNDHEGSSGRKSKGRWSYPSVFSGGSGISTGGILVAFYVALGVALVVGVLFVIGVHEKKRRQRTRDEPIYQGGRLV